MSKIMRRLPPDSYALPSPTVTPHSRDTEEVFDVGSHLAGVVAAVTTLPVVAVPMATTVLSGIDSLLSSVQMPAGVPVAAMAIDKPGAVNAAIFAAEILATSDPEIAKRLTTYKEELAKSVAEKSARVKLQYAGKTS